MNNISSFELSEAMHIIEGAQSCSICGEGFTHPESFEKHKSTHRVDEQYSCKVCSKDFTHEHQLKQHQIMHITNKPLKCNVCEATFGRNGDLARHLLSHTVPGSTTYNNGSEATGQYKPLHNQHNHLHHHSHHHSQLSHPSSGKQFEERSYKCHVCGCIFSRNGNLSRHMRMHTSSSHSHHNRSHGQYHPHRHHHHHRHHRHHHHHQHRRTSLPIMENNYRCHICKCSFAQKGDLTRHFHSHEGTQSHQPGNNNQEHCNRIAQSNHSTNGKNPFNCEACWKAFTEHPGADTHARIHAALIPFKCEVCGKGFRDNCTRERHCRTHLNEKNFTCDLCYKSFSQKSSLKLHARIHTGERPFVCDICGFAFARKDHLERHQKTNKGDRKLSCVPKHLQQPAPLLQQEALPPQQLLHQQQSQIPLPQRKQQQQSQSEQLPLHPNPGEDCPQMNVPQTQLQPTLAAQSPIATQTSVSLPSIHTPEQALTAQAQPETLSPSQQQQQLPPSEHSEIPQYLNI